MTVEVAGQVSQQIVRFRRLEYGKLCQTPEGPIVAGSECHPLMVSPMVSTELQRQCRPWLLGVGESLEPSLPHASVVRPARDGHAIVPVIYRLRQRPEDREGGRARRFWQGRYLFPDPGPVDPWTAYLALRQQPLAGIVDPQRVDSWIDVETEARSTLGEPLRDFLSRAVKYTLSGIPIVIEGLLARDTLEEEFFTYADALWRLLPSRLRPLFSAAWGVQSDLAPGFHLSAVATPPYTVAVYHYPGADWRHPKALRVLERRYPQRRDSWRFQKIHLAPGTMYRQELQNAVGGVWDPEASGSILPFLEELEDPELKGLEPPTFDTIELFQAFRRPGELCADQIRYRALETWLDRGDGETGGLAMASDQYFFPASRRRVLAAGVFSLAAINRERRCRGALVVWRSLRAGAELEEPNPIISPPTKAVLNFLAALARWQMKADNHAAKDTILERFKDVVEIGGDFTEFPEEVSSLWRQALAQGLKVSSQTRLHVGLLGSEESQAHPGQEEYLQWAQEYARPLSATLALLRGEAEDKDLLQALSRLVRLTSDPLIELLHRLCQGKGPKPGDAQALELQEGQGRRYLLMVLEHAWRPRAPEGNTLRRREGLMPWVDLVVPEEARDPLLRLAAPFPLSPVPRQDLQRLLEELELNRVPKSLEPKLAAVLLGEWSRVRYDLEPPRARSIFRHWPPELCIALGVWAPGEEHRKGAPEVLSLIENFHPERSVLKDRLASPARWPSTDTGRRGAQCLWKWCRDFRDGRPSRETTAVELCRALALGGFPEREPTAEALDQVAQLGRAAQSFPNANKELRSLWERAQEGWQIRLLLDVAPKADLEPTPDQLNAIASGHRAWLLTHLRGDISKQRPRFFAVATAEFQGIQNQQGWRPEYSNSVLWAAFSGLPSDLQGDLLRALRFYGAGESGPDSRKMASLAIRYFFAQDNSMGAASRITRALLVTWAKSNRVDSQELESVIAWVEQRMRGPSGSPRQPHGVFRRLFRSSRPRFEMASQMRVPFRRIEDGPLQVADWLEALLRELIAGRQQGTMIEEIKRRWEGGA